MATLSNILIMWDIDHFWMSGGKWQEGSSWVLNSSENLPFTLLSNLKNPQIHDFVTHIHYLASL